MTLHEKSITVDVPPERLFAYLSDVENLPRYVPSMTSAERIDGGDALHTTARIDTSADPDDEGKGEKEVEGEAWLRVTGADRSLAWGSQGPNDYHGELDVDAGDADGTSTLTVRINTERAEGDAVEQGLQKTLTGIKHNVEEADAGNSS